MVVLFTICGLAAGILGTLMTRVYMAEDSFSYFNQELNLSELNSMRSNLVIRDAKKVVVNQDVKVEETLNSLENSLVSIFKEEPAKTKIATNTPSYYSLEKPLFIGLIITSDGWAMSSLTTELKEEFDTKSFLAITSDRKVYRIDKINVLKDLNGDVVFFHLAEANNLAVRKIVPRSELSLGQSLLVIDNTRNIWPTNLSSFKKSSDILNSDTLNAFLDLANNNESRQRNSFIFNLAGDLVAVIGADKDIVPAFIYSNYWHDFAQLEALNRPFLGINYIDLAVVKVVDSTLTKGALIYPDHNKVAVVKNSPAALADLRAGDIVTWVNNQEIDQQNDLGDLISKYKAGDTITLSYIRDNQEKQVDIKLAELKQTEIK